MRRPPEFIKVTRANLRELRARAVREPFVYNGLMCAPGQVGAPISEGDTLAFPWPDLITELGQLAEEAEAELTGKPLPAWPISRLRLRPGDIVIVRCGTKGYPPKAIKGFLNSCREVFREALDKAGYGEEVQTIFTADNIDISVIAAADDRDDRDGA